MKSLFAIALMLLASDAYAQEERKIWNLPGFGDPIVGTPCLQDSQSATACWNDREMPTLKAEEISEPEPYPEPEPNDIEG